MQKVIYISEIQDYSEYVNQSVIDYIAEGQIETYESFEDYDIIAFDWYDMSNIEKDPCQILIYIDKDDLFFMCENENAYSTASAGFVNDDSNDHALYMFFRNLFKGSVKYLEQLESRISDLDDEAAGKIRDDFSDRLTDTRYEILRAKRYYEQFEFVFDELCDNDNGLFNADYLNYFEALRNRSMKLTAQVLNLREYVTQVRESYQSRIGIEQNNLMKVFTFVTSIFLPLTLIAGWYGMNLQMPEYGWRHGYLFVVFLCIAIIVLWLFVSKKNNWFK